MLVDWVCLGLMLVLVADVFLGVWSRYVLQATFQWYDEVARLCFVWMVFLGAASAVRRGAHFRLHLLIDRLGPRLRRVNDLVVGLLVVVFGGVLVAGGVAMWPVARGAGVRLARAVHGVVLRRAARRGRAHDPVLDPAPLAPGPRPLILVCLVFLVLLAIGVPVAVTVGLAGYVGAVLAAPVPLAVTVQTILHQVDSFVLLSLPLFILAGALMETGGIAHRLVRLAVALVGWVRGGLGMAVVAAEYIFSGISGSTVADVSAVASTTIPGMVRAGYSRELAVAVVSAASAMGILVPPCILMIVIGSVASLSVAALFTAGFLPAVVMALVLMAYIWRTAGRMGIAAEPRPTLGELGVAFRQALIPLGMPAIIFGGILGGIMTPTEASVLAVLYAAVVGLFVYREIEWKALPGIIMNATMITGRWACSWAPRGSSRGFSPSSRCPPR